MTREELIEKVASHLEFPDRPTTLVTADNILSDIMSALVPCATRERAWYFNAGDTVPEWLQQIEKGNCTLTFGVNIVVTSKDGGYEVRPQHLIDNPGPLMVVDGTDNNELIEIRGGGNGVNFVGYNHPYDETAEARPDIMTGLNGIGWEVGGGYVLKLSYETSDQFEAALQSVKAAAEAKR